MLTAPKINQCIEVLKKDSYSCRRTTDDESIKKIFDIVHKFKPTHEEKVIGDKTWEIWLRADRGDISDWCDYDQDWWTDKEEFEEEWKYHYPHETMWYRFWALEHKDGYQALFLNREIVYSTPRDDEEPDYYYDEYARKLWAWIIEKLNETVLSLKSNIKEYNAYVNENLPLEERTGTIARSDWYKAIPGAEKEYKETLTKEEEDLFLRFIAEQHEDKNSSLYYRQYMDADVFFKAVKCAYLGNEDMDKATVLSLTPKEAYKKFSDGRDGGLTEIDPEDPEAFMDWYIKPWGQGHYHEICRGGNSTHISLFVSYEDGLGWQFSIAGKSWSRSIETIQMYTELRRNGYPVVLRDKDIIVSRLKATDKIGIVPRDVIPVYCECMFTDSVHDFVRLHSIDNYEALLPYIAWQKENYLELA